MTKTPTHWQWEPNRRLWIFCILMLPLLVSLGFWQVDRGQQKTAEREAWQSTEHEPGWPPAAPVVSGQPVRLLGEYDPEVQWLLDNHTRDGERGYEVLQLFHPLYGDAVVVNRGWIAAPGRRDQLPPAPTPPGIVTIEGRLAPWHEPLSLGEAEPVAKDQWPRRLPSLNAGEAQAQADTPVSEHHVLLASADEPGAFRADWEPNRMEAATHYGYALQWFSLAVVLLTLTIAASFKKIDQQDDESND